MTELHERTRELLTRFSGGDPKAAEALVLELYDELRHIAQACMRQERADHTLQPTALVHEAYARLFAGGTPTLEGRAHFLRLAARAMRNVLVDHARARKSGKRGGGQPIAALDFTLAALERDELQVLDLEEALLRLEALDEELARLVELRFFGGLTLPEIAEIEGASVPTLERRWRVARAWLKNEIER